jgi:hypothetical protein
MPHVSIDTYIHRALQSSKTLLDVNSLVTLIDYPIDDFVVRSFFYNIAHSVPIYLNSAILTWLGYHSKRRGTRSTQLCTEFFKLFNHFTQNEDYWIYMDAEYRDFYERTGDQQVCYPHPKCVSGTHVIIASDCFEQLLMLNQTQNSMYVKSQYMMMKNLMIVYFRYKYWFTLVHMSDEYSTDSSDDSSLSSSRSSELLAQLDQKLDNFDKQHAKRPPAYIYIIKELDTSYVNIGYTRPDQTVRDVLKELQYCTPRKLYLHEKYATRTPISERAKLHKRYQKQHVHHDWYKFDTAAKID